MTTEGEGEAEPKLTIGKKIKFIVSQTWRFFFTLIIPVLLAVIFMWNPEGPSKDKEKYKKAPAGLYITALMASFWVSECLPLAVTSFLPIVIVPLLGISASDSICSVYFKAPTIFLFGGCVLALAFEYSNLHTRIALFVMKFMGARASVLLLGMMATCMILSCWMNNTSTTAMMVPVIYSIMDQYKKKLIPSKTPLELAKKYGIPSANDVISRRMTIATVKAPGPDEASVKEVAAETTEAGAANEPTADAKSLKTAPEPSKISTQSKEEGVPPNLEEAVAYWEKTIAAKKKKLRKIEIMLLVGVAASSNIGGTGVLTGTATNLIAINQLGQSKKELVGKNTDERDPNYGKLTACLSSEKQYWELDFVQWFVLNFLPMVVNCFVSWIYLAIFYEGTPRVLKQFWKRSILKQPVTPAENRALEEEKELSAEIKESIKKRYSEMGRTSFHEWIVIILFMFLVFLWILANPLFGRGAHVIYDRKADSRLTNDTLKLVHPNCFKNANTTAKRESEWGWNRFFGDKCDDKAIHDYVATLLVCFLLFILPKNPIYYKNIFRGGLDAGLDNPVLPIEFVGKHLPWAPLIMLGGGFGIAQAMTDSKLGDYLTKAMSESALLQSLSSKSLIAIILTGIAFMTTISSNTATAVIVSPVLITLAQTIDVPPLYLLIPPIVGASYSFILPISTPPNAIVYDKGNMKQMDMLVPGIGLTIICNLVLYCFTLTYFHYMLKVGEYNKECRLSMQHGRVLEVPINVSTALNDTLLNLTSSTISSVGRQLQQLDLD